MLNSNEENLGSDFHIYRWAQWIRLDFGATTITSHSEGAHGNINGIFPKHGTTNLTTGLSAISKYVFNYMKNRGNLNGKHFKAEHKKIIKSVRKILSSSDPFNYLKFSRQSCECLGSQYFKNIYGVHFPCIHTLFNQLLDKESYAFFKQFNNENIQNTHTPITP